MGVMAPESPSDVVEFSVLTETTFGAEVRVVGGPSALGAWCPEAGVPLATASDAYPKWWAKVPLTAAELSMSGFEYKFVVVEPDGNLVWEAGPNRRLRAEGPGTKLPTPWFGEPTPDVIQEVVFEAMCTNTAPGDVVVVVGSAEVLGSWDAAKGLRVETDSSQFPWWYGKVRIPADAIPFSWKLAIIHEDESVTWEDAVRNRTAIPPHGESACWALRVHFGGCGSPPRCLIPGRSSTSPSKHRQCVRIAGLKTSDSLPQLRLADTDECSTPGVEPPLVEERLLTLWAADVPELEGQAREVGAEVVFEVDLSRHPLRWDEDLQGWSLPFGETGLLPAVHTFYFQAAGKRAISGAFATLAAARVNVALLSDPLQRYLVRAALDRDQANEGTRSGRRLSSTRNGWTSKSHAGVTNMENQAAAWEAAKERPVEFPPHVLEGLYDGNLRLWLDGHAVPAGLPPPVKLWSGAHRLKKACSLKCEDACFTSEQALGVADGVGGMSTFADEGVDAAAFARELLERASAHLERLAEPEEVQAPSGPEGRAVSAIRAAEHSLQSFGASTVVLAVLEGSTLGVANLGDSGFMVLRKRPNGMTIVAQSIDQQHCYNTPYQLLRLPPALIARRGLVIRHIDTASDCQTYRFGLRAGDLVLLFSDGLRDNLHDREILHIVDRALPPTLAGLAGQPDCATPPDRVARALALAAKRRSVDPSAQVPFVDYSRRHGQMTCGGKVDDITVVAAWAVPE